jgi:hypothetical protein
MKTICKSWIRVVTLILFTALAALVVAGCGYLIHRSKLPNRNYQRFLDAKTQYEATFEQTMQERLCATLTQPDHPEFVFNSSTVSVTGEFSWGPGKKDYQKWTRSGSVTIVLPSSFQELDNEAIESVLEDLNKQCRLVFSAYNDEFDGSIVYEGEKDITGHYPGVDSDVLMVSSTLHTQICSGDSVYTMSIVRDGYYRDGVLVSDAVASMIDAPYVGMEESAISKTSLGEPEAKVRHNNEFDGHGGFLTANLYDFKENGWTIFTARCVNGTVTEVWDSGDTVDTSKSHAASSSTSRSSKSTDEDSYNAHDYRDAEDFYDEHYDDFFDFEDAESYFYRHRND